MEPQPAKSSAGKETYLYRIMPLRYFLQMLDSKTLYLPRVSQWDDPYELFLFKQQFIDATGRKIDMMSQASKIYGQCWSSVRKSDALWRIYSPDRMSVQIKTSVERLRLLLEQNRSNELYFRLDPVEYKSEKDLTTWIQSVGTPISTYLLDSLFIKRESFSHEKEHRLIVRLDKTTENNYLSQDCPDHIELPIDPLQMIYEVSLDPRLTATEFELLRNAIALRMGGKYRISQSTLYKFKQHSIII